VPSSDRLRSLEHINHQLRAVGSLQDHVARLVQRQPGRVEVLEVGFGYGRALLELSWRFRDDDVGFHGVDLNRYVDGDDQLREIAETYGPIPSADLAAATLPSLHYYDATQLQFPEDSLDFVYSAVTIRFMRDKALFVEEVARVLRPGGTAVLHISEGHWDYPHGPASGDRLLTTYTSRFVLLHGDELVPLGAYLQLFEGGPFAFRLTPQTRCILVLDKTASGGLSLGLRLNEHYSATGRSLPLRDRYGAVRGGYRSVYDVSPERYRELYDRGILQPLG
jgi:SAM-dependent methyltransferase